MININKPKRRLHFPTYDQTFSVWMCNQLICEEFIRIFAMDGKPVKLLSQPTTQETIKVGKESKGVRFDVVTETTDVHIYCIESQRVFMQESYTDRTLAFKSLKRGEEYGELRPVTVIFVHLENTDSVEPIDVMNVYKKKEVNLCLSSTMPYNDKLTFVDINLNNAKNCDLDSDLNWDERAFMDLMIHGDDEKVVAELLLSSRISESMRKVVSLFGTIMREEVKKLPVDENKYPVYLDTLLERDEYIMAVGSVYDKGKNDALRDFIENLLRLEYPIAEIARATQSSEDFVLEIKKLSNPFQKSSEFSTTTS